MEQADAYPDVVIGCAGGGSNFGGIAFPFIGKKLRDKRNVRVIAVEPAACPSLTRGTLRLRLRRHRPSDPAGQDAHARLRVRPAGLPRRRPALSRHVAAGQPLQGARPDRGARLSPEPVLRGGRAVRPHRGHRAGAGIEPCGQGGDRRGAEGARGRQVADDPVQPVGPRPFRHAGLHRLFSAASLWIRTTTRRRSKPRSPTCPRWRRNSAWRRRRSRARRFKRAGAGRLRRARLVGRAEPRIDPRGRRLSMEPASRPRLRGSSRGSRSSSRSAAATASSAIWRCCARNATHATGSSHASKAGTIRPARRCGPLRRRPARRSR